MVRVDAPLNVHPFRNMLGLEAVTSPPNTVVGPKVSDALPVNGRVTATLPNCVNRSICKYPVEYPAADQDFQPGPLCGKIS